MLQNIRDNAQGWLAWVIVGLISIPFALWGIHHYMNPQSETVVAEINDRELSQREFREFYHQQLRQMQAMLGNSQIDLSAFSDRLKQTTLDQLIEEELLMQTAYRHDLRVGNPLVIARIHSMPPFQENGKFSQALYHQMLKMQGMPPAFFEQQIRQEMLSDQLRQGITRSVIFTPAQRREYERLESQQRLVSYARLPMKNSETIEVTEEEIQTYFEQHADQFRTPEKASIEYVELTREDLLTEVSVDDATLLARYEENKENYTTGPQWRAAHILIESGDDETAAQKQAEEILARVKAGEDFAELAKEFSDDPISAEKGGDLGLFGEGRMVSPFEQALKQMEAGDLEGPVKSRFGFHIIKLLDKKAKQVKRFEEVRDELVQAYKQEQLDSVRHGRLDQFANLAFENPHNLDILADSMGLEKESTELFTRNTREDSGVLSHPEVISAAFKQEVVEQGFNSEVLELGDNHWLVLRIKEHQPSQARPLEEVRDKIVERLKQRKAREATQAEGKALLTKLKETGSNQALDEEQELSWSTPRWLDRQATDFEHPALAREAFRLGQPAEGKALYKGMSLANGDYALLALLEVRDADGKAEQTESEQNPSEQQRQALAQSEFQEVMDNLKARADIKIYQDNL